MFPTHEKEPEFNVEQKELVDLLAQILAISIISEAMLFAVSQDRSSILVTDIVAAYRRIAAEPAKALVEPIMVVIGELLKKHQISSQLEKLGQLPAQLFGLTDNPENLAIWKHLQFELATHYGFVLSRSSLLPFTMGSLLDFAQEIVRRLNSHTPGAKSSDISKHSP